MVYGGGFDMVETVSLDSELYMFVDSLRVFALQAARRESFYDLYFKCATPTIRLGIMLSCASHFNSFCRERIPSLDEVILIH